MEENINIDISVSETDQIVDDLLEKIIALSKRKNS